MSKEIINFMRNTTPPYSPGWGGPEFTSWQDEQLSWKSTCYIGDWSFLWDVEFEGPEALRLFRDISVNSFENFSIGQAKHVVQCDSNGKVVGEGVLMRLGENRFSSQAGSAFWSAFQLTKRGYDATWKECQTFQLQVSGPTALAVCQEVTGDDLLDIKFMHFREVTISGCTVKALRQGMAGEIGFEFHGDLKDKDAVYNAIIAAGQRFGIRRLGRRTAMINHLEAAFPTTFWHFLPSSFGPESEGQLEFIYEHFDLKGIVPVLQGSFQGESIDDYLLSPYELGWGRNVKFDHDFTGRAALEEEAKNPRKARVTLEFNNDDVIALYASLFGEKTPYDFLDIPHPHRWMTWADAVLKDGKTVGFSSSPGYSLYFRKVLTLAFIDASLSEPGTEVEVLWGNPGTEQTRIRATVAPAPYKQDKRRDVLS
ncbi:MULTISPECIES: glycine cleavage T C-terminal barrel domain-containing protein [unclassified Pseudomonas]|uniref:glycine cleavage T C-terminal barrel domain-containing protein n=1 Tax=unclassified Pseudomonas TaxID=196821 RepID=UPI000880B407|nr:MULTISPECIES: glycine cleavage T C-terminal barrel domain-containing protein [unclassified Pseudomonas]SCZ05966.1 Glycine cleavage system T protein (aminomethyltransferase) [Pseudomonas sp. NFACC37-1]SFO82367.1 Glycine cleavage system T protein (aminomethyltransferase) [Pseudomonas sp. NFACC24-1]